MKNLPGSKNPSGEVTQAMSDLNSRHNFSFVQVEVNPLAPVDPHIQYLSALMLSYMQIFGPAQGSSCPSVCADPRQHNRIPSVV